MPGLTVTEKAFWKERIAARIDRRIEAIRARHPALFERVRREGHAQALQSLGLAALHAELDTIRGQELALARHRKQVQREMLATLRGLPIDEVSGDFNTKYGIELPLPLEAYDAIEKRRRVHQEQLLADDPVGREIAHLETEKDNLLDTVWLAISPAQIKQLWTKVGALLGDEPTQLEREALTLASVKEE
jgi:hypothetical protein